MTKSRSLSRGLGSILFWSIIAAAFIGPGTITTTSKAGSGFGLNLLWALLFSIVATFILQEAAARLTIASGKSLGELLALRYGSGTWAPWILFLVILLGCMAYQAGNLLGAMAGLSLLGLEGGSRLAALLGLAAAFLLSIGKIKVVARLLGLVVAFMGLAFLYLAFRTGFSAQGDGGSIIEANWLVLGLIGTTLVPYNLFLASGIGKGQNIREMRIGLAGAIGIGGIISIAIMVAATGLKGEFSFEALAGSLGIQFGAPGQLLFAFGLFAAGFTSSVTAPLAAAVTAYSLLGKSWSPGSWRFKAVWGFVLCFGLLFVWLEVQPIPAIIAAQGLNGLLLPIVGYFLFTAMNSKELIPDEFRNSRMQNFLFLVVILVISGLGLNQVIQAIFRVWNM